MTFWVIGRRACLALLIASMWAATTGSVRDTATSLRVAVTSSPSTGAKA